LPRLFERRPPGGERADAPRRLPLTLPGSETPLWFDCATAAAEDGGVMVFAIPTDRLVRAEGSLREFVQTLTKTFAHLTTGLAVFDRERRLALFNPALTDLSALEPQFLSGRPTLYDFLDRLRERQRMPEPKDYKSWRRRIGEMEAAAATGTHIETWSLPSGQTYRVTGRPHPEGAVAFLFEDISAEISATRRYRSELELSQSVLDSLEEAIVVFSAAGSLILSNRAYDLLWACETATTLGEIGVIDATRIWQDQCEPTPAWGELRDHVQTRQDRAEWTARIRRRDGRSLACRVTPIAGNATLVGFAEVREPPRARSKLWVAQQGLTVPSQTVPQEG
jgi:PAS domain-containing protein